MKLAPPNHADGAAGDPPVTDEEFAELVGWWAGKPREFRLACSDYVNGFTPFMPAFLAAPRRERVAAKVGRNDPCPCGSGKKHKRCCG